MRLIGVTDGWAVVISSLFWLGASLSVGYLFHRLDVDRFTGDRWWSRLRRWEADGRWYQRRLRIAAWKDRLPEAGDLFAGGFDKKQRPVRSEAYLSRFAAETRRAEGVHWVLLALAPLTALWCPWWLAVAMGLYAAVANLPFIAIQRFNRGRVLAVLARRRQRSGGGRSPVAGSSRA